MKSRGVEMKPKITFPALAVLVSLATLASGQIIGKQSASEAFSELLRRRPAASSNLYIKLTAEDTRAVVIEMLLTNGKTKVLSLPVAIENDSPTAITTNLAHEWYGGIWPPTDLYVAVRKESERGPVWVEGPGYLVGEKGSADSPTKIEAGKKTSLEIRLNWPGTGSVPLLSPLIKDSEPGKYTIKLLLIFKAGASTEFVESPEIEIDAG
jgi:hypothetical protein